ncbi:MAG: tyrosine-type recombinase/integrase [Bacteroidales bacterium]|nr:tyrosine-type recombinase/integrase [Bacteroidales bacterium]
MCELVTAIRNSAGAQAPALIKHLDASGIKDWGDLTKARLFEFRDDVLESVATTSARTYFAVLKGVLARYEDEEEFCRDYRDILHAKKEAPVKTYLTFSELKKLEQVEVKGQTEKQVLYQFLIGAYTGMRISDIREVTAENVTDGHLSYVSKKTAVHAVVPCSERVQGYILWVQENEQDISLPGYNKAIRRLCKRAGINDRVKVYKAGETKTGPKHQYVSSHTARISFCTNLAKLNVPLLDISRMAGHTSTAMTERYIVNTNVELPQSALKYFA